MDMRILWLAHAVPYPPKAGFLLRSYYLLRHLAQNHEVDLVAFVQEQWMTTLFPSLEVGIAESRAALGEFCADVTLLPIDRLKRPWGKSITALEALLAGSSYTASWLVSSNARRAITRKLSGANYDLVHLDTLGLVPYRELARGIPATLMHHNIESHMMMRRSSNATHALARAYFRHEATLLAELEKASATSFVTHITCSELDSERLRTLVPGASVIAIPNGVDCSYFRACGAVPRANSLIFVGTLNWYPNVDAMLFFLRDIWPLLKQRLPAATMDVVGPNPPEPLVALGRSLPGVTIHGYVPDVRPLIDSAALYVCPIRDGGGTKLKILDAFAMNKCVIADPIACEGINVTPGTNIWFAKEPREFVDGILALLADDFRRDSIGRAARALAEREYSFDAIGARFTSAMEAAAYAMPSAAPLNAFG